MKRSTFLLLALSSLLSPSPLHSSSLLLQSPVDVTQCNATHTCTSPTSFYFCVAGQYAVQTLVKYDGGPCTTSSQCLADVSAPPSSKSCGPECESILASSPTPSPTPAPRDFIDCSGFQIPAHDSQNRIAWLADGQCDAQSMFGLAANFNCLAWGYDCCDCRSKSCDPGKYDVCHARRRGQEEEGMSPPFSSAEEKLKGITDRLKVDLLWNVSSVLGGDATVPPASYDRLLSTTQLYSTSCFICSPGSFCPQGITETSDRICPPNNYCPNPLTKLPCPLDAVCVGKSVLPCVFGMSCPINATETKVCPPGSYCPRPSEIHECPEKHYCRGGDVEPRKCAFYMKCQRGSTIPQGTAGAFIGLLVAVALLIRILRFWNDVRKGQKLKAQQYEEKQRRADKNVANFFMMLHDKRISVRNLNISSPTMQGQGEEPSADVEAQSSSASAKAAATAPLSQQQQQQRPKGKNLANFKYLKPDPTPVSFKFNDLALVLKNGTRIIDRVTGSVESGKLTAIMGPSGCG